MVKTDALRLLATVGSSQVLMKTVADDVQQAFEEAPSNSDLEESLAIVQSLTDSMRSLLDVARRHAEKNYDESEEG